MDRMDSNSIIASLTQRRYEASDRMLLLWLRWLFFIILLFLFLYNVGERDNAQSLTLQITLLTCYALSNAALTWASRRNFSLARWGVPIFILDMVLIGLTLFYSIGPDTDLYVMCFLIIYLSTLGRSVRDALPLALIACLIYGLFMVHQNPNINFMSPRLLLRFPFFLVLSLFTSYLAEQSEKDRQQIVRLKEVQTLLATELQKAMVELRDKQSALVQAEKLTAMGHMAGALAHEIRNPLSVIIGYVEDSLQDRGPEDPMTKVLEAIKRSAQRCKDLMENLLIFARRPKEVELFLLKDALQETIALVRISAKMTQVQCTLDARCNPTLSARRSEIQQVFINLMSNAVDAMSHGGNLTVLLEEENTAGHSWAKVTVEDTGEGIPENIRSRIFETFFTTKDPGKGTGLGLSIVQDIVQSNHGLIEVQSELHKGTRMIVRLPTSPEVPAAPSNP